MNNFELIKETDDELGIKEHKWYGKQDQTETNLLHDKGTGDKIVLRNFEFKVNPELKTLPTKEQILTPEYVKHLSVLLWADSLRLLTTPEVRIDKEYIRVFAACVPRTGATLSEEPKYLQEWMK